MRPRGDLEAVDDGDRHAEDTEHLGENCENCENSMLSSLRDSRLRVEGISTRLSIRCTLVCLLYSSTLDIDIAFAPISSTICMAKWDTPRRTANPHLHREMSEVHMASAVGIIATNSDPLRKVPTNRARSGQLSNAKAPTNRDHGMTPSETHVTHKVHGMHERCGGHEIKGSGAREAQVHA